MYLRGNIYSGTPEITIICILIFRKDVLEGLKWNKSGFTTSNVFIVHFVNSTKRLQKLWAFKKKLWTRFSQNHFFQLACNITFVISIRFTRNSNCNFADTFSRKIRRDFTLKNLLLLLTNYHAIFSSKITFSSNEHYFPKNQYCWNRLCILR